MGSICSKTINKDEMVIQKNDIIKDSAEKIWFFTDIEGDLDHFTKLMLSSPALQKDKKNEEFELKDNWQVVFGGDCCDHGSGDLFIIHTLLSLKLRYPERVHLVLGNRDVNKLRIPFELSDYAMKSPPHLYWVKKEFEKQNSEETKPERLKWLLTHSFGAPKAFEGRSIEMKEQLRAVFEPDTPSGNYVLDDEVLRNFLLQLDPTYGKFTMYLEKGCLLKRIASTLFVHGSITSENFLYVPSSIISKEKGGSDLDKWIEDMNTLVGIEMNRYREDTPNFLENLGVLKESSEDNTSRLWAADGTYDHPQPGSNLVQMGMSHLGSGDVNKTIIYGNYLSQKPEENISQLFKASGIRFVVTGHQPVGDIAFIQKCKGVYFVSGDISYAGNVMWFQREGVFKVYKESKPMKSTRGSFAVCNIVVKTEKIRIYGMLSNEFIYDFCIPDEEYLVGTELKDGWHLSAINVYRSEKEPTPYLLLTKHEGFICKNRLIFREELSKWLN
jgi:hypothetical protein